MRILKADRIIIGDGESVVADGAVAINNKGLIEEVGGLSELSQKYPEADRRIMDNCTLMPGLIDMHVHMATWYGSPDAAQISNNLGHKTLLAYKNLKEALAVGITTVRAVAEPKGLGDALRAGFHKGYIKGPRYLTCERAISITGGHGAGKAEKPDSAIEADGPWEVRKAVRQCLKDGADWIKMMASHRTHYSEYTLEEMVALADETHRLGKKCCVHAATRTAIEYAIEAGIDTIEHGAFLTPDLAERAAEKGIAWVPTAFIYMYASEYLLEKLEESGRKPTEPELVQIKYFEDSTESYKKNFKANKDTGITIATGTDVVFHDRHITPIAKEIKALVSLGLTPIEALKCATSNGAKILEKDDEFGTISKGLCADILIVEGNPLEDLKHLDNVKEVYREGELLYKA